MKNGVRCLAFFFACVAHVGAQSICDRQICSGGDPCTIAESQFFGDDCFIDFGAVAVSLPAGVSLTAQRGKSIDLRAKSFTVDGYVYVQSSVSTSAQVSLTATERVAVNGTIIGDCIKTRRIRERRRSS